MSTGKKPKAPKVVNATSQFKGVQQASFGSDFGTGFSSKNPVLDDAGNPIKGKFSLDTTTELADYLQPIPRLAATGIEGNLGFLQQTPQEQYDNAIGGSNPLYNLLTEATKRNTDKALGRSLVDNQGTGTMNSTTAGAAQGMILNDQIMRSNNDLLQAINFSNDTSRQNLGANLNALGSMANLTYPLGSAANANLMQAFAGQDAIAQANAAAQNAANLQHANAMNQYRASQGAGLGSGIGSLIGGGLALAAAPFTGGASLSFLPMAMGAGGSIGGMVQGSPAQYGGSGYAPAPSFQWTNPFSSPGSFNGMGAGYQLATM